MHSFWLLIGVLGGLFVLALKGMRSRRHGTAEARLTPAQKVKAVLASGDAERMAATIAETDDLLLKDALLGHIVAIHYRERKNAQSRAAFYRYAEMHIEHAPEILDALEQSDAGRPDRVHSFRMMAIVLEEDHRYDEAIGVCQRALALGLDDGTRTGFEGRIARLVKKRDRHHGDENR